MPVRPLPGTVAHHGRDGRQPAVGSSLVRRRWQDLLVLLGFTAVSFAYLGWRLLPHPGRVLTGFGNDNQIYVWSFAWWPHAIASWTNPLVSHAVYAPTGIDLAWTASAPGLALLFSPLTVLVGPVVSYNVAAVLLPAIAAWTSYLLCRYLTDSTWAAVVGGYLFGFSAAVLRQLLFGHLNLTAVFLLPLLALVVIRHVRGETSRRRLVLQLGLLLSAQLWISTEFALTATLALVGTLALAFLLAPQWRSWLRALVVAIAGSYAVGALVAAPLLI